MERAGLRPAGRPRPRERRLGARGRRRRDSGGGGRRGARLPAVQLRPLRRRAGAGFDIHCERHQFTGLTRDGGFSEYVLVDERSLDPAAGGVDPAEVAPHADAGITAYHAVKKLSSTPRSRLHHRGRDRVGGVGHIGLQLLRVSAAGRSSGSTRTSAGAPRARARCRRGAGRRGRCRRRRARGDERRGRRRRARLRRDRCHPRSRRCKMLARRGLYSIVGYGGHRSPIPSVGFVVGGRPFAGKPRRQLDHLWELLRLHVRGQITLRTEMHPLEEVNGVLDSSRRRDHRPGGPRPITDPTSVQERLFDVRDTRAVVTVRCTGSAMRSPRSSRSAEHA